MIAGLYTKISNNICLHESVVIMYCHENLFLDDEKMLKEISELGDVSAIVNKHFSKDKFWITANSISDFESLSYDVDSLIIIGDPSMRWLTPPVDFECRLDIVNGEIWNDTKVGAKGHKKLIKKNTIASNYTLYKLFLLLLSGN